MGVVIPLYRNRWMPGRVLETLARETGPILDVGGGAAPYARADHVLDIIPHDPARLAANAWGGEARGWDSGRYTALDVCAIRRWPFPDETFALGLCSHSLEDMRDPLPALAEMSRVCRRLLIITPSRTLEQTRGIDHPRYAGFAHHPWIVGQDAQGLYFRRKTVHLQFRGCHFVCPFGATLPVEDGCFVYEGPPTHAREVAYWSEEQDLADYRAYVASTTPTFVRDSRPVTLARRVHRFRQYVFGAT